MISDEDPDFINHWSGPSTGMRAKACPCGITEARATCGNTLQEMGWVKINGAWLCPACCGRTKMANEYWRHWYDPPSDRPLEL